MAKKNLNSSEATKRRSDKGIDLDSIEAIESRLIKLAEVMPWERRHSPEVGEEETRLKERLEVLTVQNIPMAETSSLGLALNQDIEIDLIDTDGNHRELSHEADTIRLARSIEQVGLQQPIGLRAQKKGDRYLLIFGSRRLAAMKMLKKDSIPAKVYSEKLSSAEVELLRTIENFNRAELTPTERALAVVRMIEANKGRADCHAYVGQLLGKPEAWVRDHEYINRLGGQARRLLQQGRIDLGHARELAKINDQDKQDSLADDVSRREDGTGGRTVDCLTRQVTEALRSLKGVPWKLDVIVDCEGSIKSSCGDCRFNSRHEPGLFANDPAMVTRHSDERYVGTCTNPGCFNARTEFVNKELDKQVASIVKKAESAAAKAKSKGHAVDDDKSCTECDFETWSDRAHVIDRYRTLEKGLAKTLSKFDAEAAVDLLVNPQLEHFAKFEEICNVEVRTLAVLHRDFIAAIANRLGIQFDAPPTPGQFVKEFQEEATKPRSDGATKGKKKKPAVGMTTEKKEI